MADQFSGTSMYFEIGSSSASFFLFNQHHDGHRRELLSDRAGLKHCLRRDAYAVLKVRNAVSLAKHEFAIVTDHHRTPRNFVFLQVFVYKIAKPIRRCESCHREKQQRNEQKEFYRWHGKLSGRKLSISPILQC